MTASSSTTRSTRTAAPTADPGTGSTTTPGRAATSTAARVLPVAAGVALVAGPLLWSLGMVTSPPQDSMADADYIASLARDTTMTQVSALLLHYGNLAIGVGVLALPALVRGVRGRWPAVVGALLTALGFLNVSGMVLSDWWNASAGRALTSEQAVEVFRGVKEGSLLWMWDGTELFSLLGPLLLFVGLARAGVLGWWSLALFVGGVVGLMAFGATTPLVAAALVLVGFSPFALAGARVVTRARL